MSYPGKESRRGVGNVQWELGAPHDNRPWMVCSLFYPAKVYIFTELPRKFFIIFAVAQKGRNHGRMDIVVSEVTKSYGSQKALNGLSFTARAGEVLGFLGPNGAGKTTTMKSIACYITPDSGTIKVGRYSVKDHPREVRAHIGYLPERNPLYEDMFVSDYLRYMALLQGVSRKNAPSRIREMIRICGLEPECHKQIGALSKGYRQRVGLAQAIIHDPAVLILDEPVSGLDPNQVVEIRELIRSLGASRTVLLSSHILPEAELTCDRMVIITHGRVVAEGTPENLRSQFGAGERLRLRIEDVSAELVREALLSLNSVTAAQRMEDGSFEVICTSGSASRKALFALCVDKQWNLTEMVPCTVSLESVFRELTK